jgi:hypothetical protein
VSECQNCLATPCLCSTVPILKKMFSGIPYTFHREGGFYPLGLQSDAEAIANAECNKGTLKVVNEITRQTVWQIGGLQ